MKPMKNDWYKKIWKLDIKDQSWVENTKLQIDFIINKLKLNGSEKVLDLACGFGRHSLELARRGFSVTGVDITEDYIKYADEIAKKENLNAQFINSDIRELNFQNEFDIILNMADGAIGYLETEEENLRIFKIISNALKQNGKHFMDIMNADYAETHFPCKMWDNGEKSLTLSKFEWNSSKKIMLYGQLDFMYGNTISKPIIEDGNPIRLYSINEIKDIFNTLGMDVKEVYSDFTGKPLSNNDIQLMVYSEKL